MRPPLLRQSVSSAAASFQEIANQNKIAGEKSLTKASPLATQDAQSPAVGMPKPYRHTMSAPMTFPSLTGKDKARFYSMVSGNTSYEKSFLPHHPLDEKDHQTLKAVLGADLYEKLRHRRHRGGLCHADTTVKMIEAANYKEVSSVTARLMNLSVTMGKKKGLLSIVEGIISNALNVGVPFHEGIKGNSYCYDKSQLLEQGVPKDSMAVVISAVQGAIDPNSKQALSASASFKINAGAGRGSNHAFAVLHVDHENGQMLCCDLDPYRQNTGGTDKDVYFKVDKKTFQERVLPRLLNGVMAIKKQVDSE